MITGLQSLQQPSQVDIYSPSKYVIDGASKWLAGWERNGWRTRSGRTVKNRELWEELSDVMGDHDIRWHHLAADASHSYASEAATAARESAEQKRDQTPSD